jgi:hypothetical protein
MFELVVALAVATQPSNTVSIGYTEQGCLGESGTNVNMILPLAEHMQALGQRGSVRPERLVFSPLRLGDVILFPGDNLDDLETLDRFFAATGDVTRTVVSEGFSVLEDHYQILTEWPVPTAENQAWVGFVHDKLQQRGQGVQTRNARRVSLTRGRATIHALELDDARAFAEPGDLDRSAWLFQPAVVSLIHHAGIDSKLIEFGKRLGEDGRTAAMIAELRKEPDSILVHPGSLIGLNAIAAEREACPKVLKHVPLDAVGVRAADLALGAQGLFSFAT